ncbi:uncharacterized protein LOC120904941 isoform X1 [Anopheles arabiensis]|uniref:uncharacterized protein LOC120904941 isoform X1 n=1 Tax=Anopheles arabiensis TaxID=7173 RepID=UPI001AADE768|nr:uncharacterized protein LOC120904941 isoform X1 [Anopheles arabiensis]
MNGSKSSSINQSLTAAKLQRIIKNVRAASRADSAACSTSSEDHKKFAKGHSSPLPNAGELKISCRKLTAHEIDKLINCLPSTQSPPPPPSIECCSSISATDKTKQQVHQQQEAPELSISNGQLQVESEISFTSSESNARLSRSTPELPADVEDNLVHSSESLGSSFGVCSQTYHASSQLNSCPPTFDPTVSAVTLFAFRPIEPGSSEEYESYGETSRSDDVDRPIMQVKVRPLASALLQQQHQPVLYRRYRQQSDDEQPLIDFRQIERNTRAAARKALGGGGW